MVSARTLERYYPRVGVNALGYPGAHTFYGWVREVTTPRTIMLNLGAGGPAPRHKIRVFRGEVARVVGADPDPEVINNSELDEAHVLRDHGRLPFADDCFDLVLSDWVVEHVAEPIWFLKEVRRVLRSGGSFFFRTPNKRHYVGLIASMTPHWFHELVANRARGLSSDEHEPWPTYYRLNTLQDIQSAGCQAGFRSMEVRTWEGPPVYMVFNSAAFLLGVAFERVVNRFEALAFARANLFARMIK
jgi:SAM-dependent methyltransferase